VARLGGWLDWVAKTLDNNIGQTDGWPGRLLEKLLMGLMLIGATHQLVSGKISLAL